MARVYRRGDGRDHRPQARKRPHGTTTHEDRGLVGGWPRPSGRPEAPRGATGGLPADLDPEKRLALSRSVEAFYPEAPQPQRPTSRHFALATRLLDQASKEKDARKRERLPVEAEEELDFALAEEGAGRVPEVVRAHIEFQRGPLPTCAAAITRKPRTYSTKRARRWPSRPGR